MAAPTRTKMTHSTSVAARYNNSSNPSIVSGTILDWANKDYDTHNAVTTGASWKFTAPLTGTYVVSVHFRTNSATVGALCMHVAQITGSTIKMANGTSTIKLNQGDYIDVRGINNTGQTHTLNSSALNNFIEIAMVGE